MSDRVSATILLCEDLPQARLVRAYMTQCGRTTASPYFRERIASRETHGGNVVWVLQEFPRELKACRHRHRTHSNTQIIVVADADHQDVAQRRQHLNDYLKHDGEDELSPDDPAVVLIPRRNIETWIAALIGLSVNETDDYKKRDWPSKADMRQAGSTAYDWARDHAIPGPTCVPSLAVALPEWHKIG